MSVCLPCFRHELVFISSSEAHRQPILPPTHRGENAIAKLKCGELAAGGMSSREVGRGMSESSAHSTHLTV